MPTNNSWNSQDPAQVAKGGTGIATTTAYAPICGGTTATGAMQAASTGLSSSGYVLTSNGASAVPSFQPASGSVPAGAQLMFLARLTSTLSNVTGSSVEYVIVYDTADVNVGSCYNTGTGTFTVPSTGIYLFQSSLWIEGYTSSNTSINWFQTNNTTTNQSHYWYIGNVNTITNAGTGGIQLMGQTYQCPTSISAGNTINMHLQVTDGGQVIDLVGSTTDCTTWWACYKITPAGENQFPWTEITAASANLANNNGYIANRGSLVTLTLPTTSAVGSIIEVVGKGSGGWKIALNANQIIHINAASSTTGASGYLSSNDRYNSVKLLCTVADLEFTVLSSEGTLNLN